VASDPPHATAQGLDPLGASARENASPGLFGAGDVGHQHRLLGAEEAAQDAESTLDAVLAVVVRHQARVAELLGAGANHPIHRIDLVLANRLHLEIALDAFEALREGLGGERRQAEFAAPEPEDRLRRPEGVAEVVDGGSADVAPLEDDHRAVRGLAHSRLLEQARQHLSSHRRNRGRPVRTLLEHQH
jgi:hypothetical protein